MIGSVCDEYSIKGSCDVRHGARDERGGSTVYTSNQRKEGRALKLSKLATDKVAGYFITHVDLTDYDLAAMQRMRFEFCKEAKAAMPKPMGQHRQ